MVAALDLKKRNIDELRGLYADLHRLGQDFREASIKFKDMVRGGGFKERGRTYSYAPDDPKDVLNRSIDITREFEFLVAVTGAFSSGKSTILNLLLEQDGLLPSSVIPMTAVCTVIRHAEQRRVRVRYVSYEEGFERAKMCIDQPFLKPFGPTDLTDALEAPETFVEGEKAQAMLRRFAEVLGRYERIVTFNPTFEERQPFISGGGVLPARNAGEGPRYFAPTPAQEREYLDFGGDPRNWVTREWLALVKDVCLWVPSPILENNMVFLDLPGLNCREDYHRRAIQHYCNMADCIVVTAFQPGNQADEEIINNFKELSTNYSDKVFFVFNKVDQFAKEPQELVRAVDYLARDTIGADFPRDRFFLTSGLLARTPANGAEVRQLKDALGEVAPSLPDLDGWVKRVASLDDPGGVGYLRGRVHDFLMNDAYQTKLQEIVRNYAVIAEDLKIAASPTFEETLHMDPSEILRKSVLDFFRHSEKLGRNAIYRFRFDYLRGHHKNGVSVLREDLKIILDDLHVKVQDAIDSYFDRPILSAPLREDPVSEFDLLTIADDASHKLRRDLQDMIIAAIHEGIRGVFHKYLERSEFKEHIGRIFKGAPECSRRLEGILARFEETMLHSLKVIVRNGFFHMPRGRELKRLERTVALAQMKDTLVEIFTDYYPAWIYENIYGDVIDDLWLSLFLDSEDLEEELTDFFRDAESVVTGIQVAEQVEVPQQHLDGSRNLYRTVRMCQQIDELLASQENLAQKARSLGVSA